MQPQSRRNNASQSIRTTPPETPARLEQEKELPQPSCRYRCLLRSDWSNSQAKVYPRLSHFPETMKGGNLISLRTIISPNEVSLPITIQTRPKHLKRQTGPPSGPSVTGPIHCSSPQILYVQHKASIPSLAFGGGS